MIAEPYAIFFHISKKFFPFFGERRVLFEPFLLSSQEDSFGVFTAGVELVGPAFPGDVYGCEIGVIRVALEETIDFLAGFLAVVSKFMGGEVLRQSQIAETHAAVAQRGALGFLNGIVVEGDDVVENAHYDGKDLRDHLRFIDGSDVDGSEVADHEVARLIADNYFPILYYLLDEFGGRGILTDFRAELGGVDIAGVFVGVQAVDRIAEKNIRHTGFDG